MSFHPGTGASSRNSFCFFPRPYRLRCVSRSAQPDVSIGVLGFSSPAPCPLARTRVRMERSDHPPHLAEDLKPKGKMKAHTVPAEPGLH